MQIIPHDDNAPIAFLELRHLIQFLDNYARNRAQHREVLRRCFAELEAFANDPEHIAASFQRDRHARDPAANPLPRNEADR